MNAAAATPVLAVVLAGLWFAAIVALGVRHSPVVVRRLDALTAGRPVARLRPRVPPVRIMAVALVATVAFVVLPPLAPAVVAGMWLWPRITAARARRAAERAVVDALPDTVDLFALAVAGGSNVALALTAVAARAPPPLRDALGQVERMVAGGHRLADAVEQLPAIAGEPARSLATVLASAARYGAPLLPSLERLSFDVRLDRRRRAEEAARRVPVQLLFPLVLFILPAFALLTVVPLLAGALDGLRL